jgi:hypothetical protein
MSPRFCRQADRGIIGWVTLGTELLLLLLLLLPQALQGFGLQPQLEYPVHVGTANTQQQPPTQLRPAALTTTTSSSSTIATNSSSSSSSSSDSSASSSTTKIAFLEDNQGSCIMVDIACLAPAQLVQDFQQHGLKPTLQSHKSNSCSSSSSSSSSSSEADLSATADQARDVLLAVEVDGSSHVAVNCWSHALGSTVSRTWLLQQQGWTVLEVPWWQWEATM